MMTEALAPRVCRVSALTLRAVAEAWTYASLHADAIERHWQQACLTHPNYFNGTIYMANAAALYEDRLDATLLRTDFKSYLYWRHHGYPDAGVLDAFGSALILSLDGAIVLGRQRPGNVNAGLAYLPGGFIDARDVSAAGSIDITASVLRELGEEAGIAREEVRLEGGYLITRSGSQLSIAVPCRLRLTALQVRDRIRAHIAADPDPELEDAVIVRTASDLEGLAVPPYVSVLLGGIFSGAPVAGQ